MRNAGGYAVLVTEQGTRECDTFTCAHCNTIVHVNAGTPIDDLGGFCRSCMKMICPKCVGFSCDPIEEKLKRAEARDAARRSYGV